MFWLPTLFFMLPYGKKKKKKKCPKVSFLTQLGAIKVSICVLITQYPIEKVRCVNGKET